jgi:hypothetical protein
VGFLPLNDLLERDGLMDKIVSTRFAPWSKEGVIFGVPHDVHPVGITYRKDLFDEAGIDLAAAETWEEFHLKCRQLQEYWRDRGVRGRYAIELPAASASYLLVMLMQRGINVLDDQDRVHINDPKVAETIAFYARMVRGPERIAAEATPGGVLWVRDMVNGDICAFVTPDWRVGYIRAYAPELEGKVRFMPLPRFDPEDHPTSTWGGTMIGIPRNCRDPEASWDLLKFLYFSPECLAARLLQAGRVDGCSELRLWWEVALPIVRPMIGAFTLLSFLGAWNTFLWPQIILQNESMYTLPIGLANMVALPEYRTEYGILMCGTLLSVLPVMVLFFVLQRDFVSGLSSGAIKG